MIWSDEEDDEDNVYLVKVGIEFKLKSCLDEERAKHLKA